MPELDITTNLRAGADNIHSIGPVQAANLLRAAAETIDALRRDFAEARQLASRYGIELGPHFAAHGEHARAANQRGTNIPYLGTEPLVERRLDPEARRRLDNVTSKEAHRLLGLDKVQPHILGAQGRISVGGDPKAIASLGLAEERGCQPGTCLAEPRCRNRAEMRAAHGTPAEFAAAIARAAPELLGSEAERAIVTYNAAWAAATEPSAALQRAINSELLAMHCNSASATQAEFKRALESATKRVEMDVMPAEVARVIGPNEASCIGCEGEQFEGAICDHCGDHIELARNSDGTFRRVYHSPEQILAMNLADPDSPEAVMRRDLEELGATEDGYTNDLRAAVALPRTGFKLTRDPTSYDPDNPCADPTLEPEKT